MNSSQVFIIFASQFIRKMKLQKLLFFGLLLLGLTACGDLQFQHIDGNAFGTYYAVTYKGKENPNLQHSVDSILDEINATFSIFNDSSLISKINNNQEVTLNNDFMEVFTIAQKIGEETNGSFEMTIGPLVNLWGFGKHHRDTNITQEQIDSVLQLVSYKKISIQNQQIVKENPDIKLDFNALAKGYAVDKVAEFLVSQGYKDCLVDIGGEIVAKGKKYHDEMWNIGVQEPTETRDGELRSAQTFHLCDQATATSGNYRNYFEENGQRYTHIINPRTGRPEKSNLLSVTVIADRCVTADAYATAFMVMGREKSKEFLKNHPELQCIFIYDDQGKYKLEVSQK